MLLITVHYIFNILEIIKNSRKKGMFDRAISAQTKKKMVSQFKKHAILFSNKARTHIQNI